MANVTLSAYLGIIVWKELEKKGIQRRINPQTGMLSYEFTQEKLDSIGQLHLTDIGLSLEGISNLRNLKKLYIDRTHIRTSDETMKSKIYMPREHYNKPRDVPSISDRDLAEIGTMESLEELAIVGQSKVTSFDVSRLTKLKSLKICGNMRLETVRGLENLQQLDWLVLIGNDELTKASGLNQYLNNPLTKTVSLDPQLFPQAVNYDHQTGGEDTRLIERMKGGNIDIDFYETMTARDDIKMNLGQMLVVHEKAKNIVRAFNTLRLKPRGKIMMTQAYLGDTIKYDTASLHSNQSNSEEGVTKGPEHGANGLYNCMVLETCVCQGYTRGAKYLYTLQGISSREVHCISGRDTGYLTEKANDTRSGKIELPDDGYHSILLVQDDVNQESGYCDACWNATYFRKKGIMPFVLMGTEEIKRTHTLSLEEQGVLIESNPNRRARIAKEMEFVLQLYKQHTKKLLPKKHHNRASQQDEPEM